MCVAKASFFHAAPAPSFFFSLAPSGLGATALALAAFLGNSGSEQWFVKSLPTRASR